MLKTNSELDYRLQICILYFTWAQATVFCMKYSTVNYGGVYPYFNIVRRSFARIRYYTELHSLTF